MSVFYKSVRIGQYGKPFFLLKFRTFKNGMHGGSPTASLDDPRLTSFGRWLRRYKLDELPTIINLIKGDIRIVGPRPDVPLEIESLDKETREIILGIKPGLFSPATLWDINEDQILEGETDAHKTYCKKIKPIKYALNVWYIRNKSIWLDIKVIIATLIMILRMDKGLIKRYISKIWQEGLPKNIEEN